MHPSERRLHPRVAISVAVDVRSEHNFYMGRTRDISEGGLFIEGPLGLRVGATARVELALLNRKYTVDAEVVWALLDPAGQVVGVGMKFLNPPARLVRSIRAFAALRHPMLFECEAPDLDDDPPEDPSTQRAGPTG